VGRGEHLGRYCVESPDNRPWCYALSPAWVGKTAAMSSSLPGEVVSYLRSHGTFDIDTSPSECGAVVLASADALAVRDFWVDGEGRDWPDDPHAGDGAHYVVPGVDLVGAVEASIPTASSGGSPS